MKRLFLEQDPRHGGKEVKNSGDKHRPGSGKNFILISEQSDVEVFRFPDHYDGYLLLLGAFGFLQREQRAGPCVVPRNAVDLELHISTAAGAAVGGAQGLQAKLQEIRLWAFWVSWVRIVSALTHLDHRTGHGAAAWMNTNDHQR